MVEPMKACDLCGSNAELGYHCGVRFVQCINEDCKQQGPLAWTDDEAITAWNQRAHPTGEVGDIVELQSGHAEKLEGACYDLTEKLLKAWKEIEALQSRLSISDENVERLREALKQIRAISSKPTYPGNNLRDIDLIALASLGGVG
jgi:hypothetical protein